MHYCAEGAELTCDARTCDGCNAYLPSNVKAPRTYYDTYYKTKETKVNMKLSDMSVNIGNKTYSANSIDWVQTPGEYPAARVTCILDPNDILKRTSTTPTITNVIFNPPATIVFWSDRTKTVVKCNYDYEDYDPEKGLAMAIAKKMIGDNKRAYYHTFLHWMKKWEKQNACDLEEIERIIKPIKEQEFTLTCAPGSVFLDGKQFSGVGEFTCNLGDDDDDADEDYPAANRSNDNKDYDFMKDLLP